MSLVNHKRSASLASLAHSSLREIQARRNSIIADNSIAILKHFRTSYQQPFTSIRHHHPNTQEQNEEQHMLYEQGKLVKDEFQQRCRKVCEQLCFHLQVFEKLYRQNHRKKSLLVKFYGWDKDFQQAFFFKNKEELRPDLTPQSLFLKLGFGCRTFDIRNVFNKLRLFLNEVIVNNRKQQEQQSKFLKIRLNNHLNKLDKEIIQIAKDREKNHFRGYIEDIGHTHQHMMNTKIKIHNKMQSLRKIQQDTGRIKIKQFYGTEERDIDEVEKFFTRIRLNKRT